MPWEFFCFASMAIAFFAVGLLAALLRLSGRLSEAARDLDQARNDVRTLKTQFEALARRVNSLEQAAPPTTIEPEPATAVTRDQEDDDEDLPILVEAEASRPFLAFVGPMPTEGYTLPAHALAPPAPPPPPAPAPAAADRIPDTAPPAPPHEQSQTSERHPERAAASPAEPYEIAADAEPEPAPATASAPSAPQTATPPALPVSPASPATSSTPARPPRPPINVEQLVVRAIMWVAAIALAFGVAFLVKVSFESDLLSDRARLMIGAALGTGAVCASEFFRKRHLLIARALSAGGVASLFAVLLAGVHWYAIIPPAIGFLMMGIVAGGAVALSLRQGIMVAIVGLVGGFATPALIGPTEYPPGLLFAFLFLLEVALIAVTRRRRWWLLSALTLMAGYGWVAVWLLVFFEPQHSVALGMFLAATAAAFVLAPAGTKDENTDDTDDHADDTADADSTLHLPVPLPQLVRWCGAGVGLVLMALVLGVGDYQPTSWGFFAVIGAGAMLTARLDRRSFGLAWVAAGMGLAMLLAWRIAHALAHGNDPIPPDAAQLFTVVAVGFGLLYTFGPYALIWTAQRAARWSTLAVFSALAHSVVAWIALRQQVDDAHWLASLLGADALVGLAAAPVYLRRTRWRDGTSAAGHLTLAALALGAIACWCGLHDHHLGLGWAALMFIAAGLYSRLDMPAVRNAVAAIALGVALVMLSPLRLHDSIAPRLLFNWLFYAYPFCAVAFAAAAWMIFRRRGDSVLVQALESGACASIVALVLLAIRNGFHPGYLLAPGATYNEIATFVVALLACTAAARLVGERIGRAVPRGCAIVTATLALLASALGLGLFWNPLFLPQPVAGVTIFNHLLYAFGLPALLWVGIAWLADRRDMQPHARIAGTTAAGLFAWLAALLVRHGYHPNAVALDTNFGFTLAELSTCTSALLAITLGLFELLRVRSRYLFPAAPRAVGGIVLVIVALGLLLTHNPLFNRTSIAGVIVFNELLYIYGLPALLAGLLAYRLRSRDDAREESKLAAAGAIILAAALVTLEVRHGFQGDTLTISRGSMGNIFEFATYAVAALSMAIALAVPGRRSQSTLLINAAAAMTAIALLILGPGLLVFLNPAARPAAVRDWPVINGLLYIYGLPLIMLGLVAWLLHQHAPRWASAAAGASAAMLALALVALQIRHGFHRDHMHDADTHLVETATYAVAYFAAAIVALRCAPRFAFLPLRHAARALIALAIVISGLGTLLLLNPLWSAQSIAGVRIFNSLLYVYGLPGVLAAIASWMWAKQNDRAWMRTAGAAALVLLFALISLEVRHWFHPHAMHEGGVLMWENISYSGAWAGFAIFLLVPGIAARSAALRWASLVVLLVAVGKLFLLDMSQQRDLFRVASFIGMSLVLLAVGYLYNRFVFRRATGA